MLYCTCRHPQTNGTNGLVLWFIIINLQCSISSRILEDEVSEILCLFARSALNVDVKLFFLVTAYVPSMVICSACIQHCVLFHVYFHSTSKITSKAHVYWKKHLTPAPLLLVRASVCISVRQVSTHVARATHSSCSCYVYMLHKHPGKASIALHEYSATRIMRTCEGGGVFSRAPSLVSSRRWSQFANSPWFPVFHLTLVCSRMHLIGIIHFYYTSIMRCFSCN